jgi:hypothetical protein
MILPKGCSYWPEYQAWRSIIARCSNKKDRAFPYYGGRGISFDPKWSSFSAFISDVGRRPTSKHSIDRYPDNDGDYRPGNVRWATRKQQQANTRKTRYVIFNGKRVPFCTAYQAIGMTKETALARIRLGWSPQQAIDTPVIPRNFISANVRRQIRDAIGSQDNIADQFGVSQSTVSSIKRGSLSQTIRKRQK